MEGQTLSQLDYLERGAKFDMKKFFNGEVEGFAIIQDGSGKITDTKSITISGDWEENKGVIKKVFISANGSKDSRTWLITADRGGTFTAIGHDIAAPAKGSQMGNAMQMGYALLLPGQIPGQKEKVYFEDKIYVVNADSAIMITKSSGGINGETTKIVALKKLSKAQRVSKAISQKSEKIVKSFNVISAEKSDQKIVKKDSKKSVKKIGQ